MNQRALALAIVLFVLIIGGMFGYAYLKKNELKQEGTAFIETPAPVATTTEKMHVNAIHFFKNGTHTIIGEIVMPTPCDLIRSDVSIASGTPMQASIALTTINNAQTCAQVLTPQRFKSVFQAAKDTRISLMLDGKDADLNLKDADPSQTPDNVDEFFFKG